MRYSIENIGKELTVSISGEIDHHNCIFLREETDAAIREYKPERLKIDFSKLDFMDSSGFGFVMGRYKLMKKYDGQVCVCGCSSRIEKMLKMSGAQAFIQIESEAKI